MSPKPSSMTGVLYYISLWSGLAILSLIIGYLSVPPSLSTSKITLGVRPETQPNESYRVDLWSEKPSYIESKDALVLVTEKNDPTQNDIRFFCPRFPNEKCDFELRFPVQPGNRIERAFLRLNLLAATVYDPVVKLNVFVESEATHGSLVELLELSAASGEDQIPREFDILPFVQGSSYLRIRITCIASQLIYHPTPNDPIGYAACQALRQPRYENAAACLEIWHRSASEPP